MSAYIALLAAQLTSSINVIVSRASFTMSPIHPLTFAVWKALLTMLTLGVVRWCCLSRTRPPPSPVRLPQPHHRLLTSMGSAPTSTTSLTSSAFSEQQNQHQNQEQYQNRHDSLNSVCPDGAADDENHNENNNGGETAVTVKQVVPFSPATQLNILDKQFEENSHFSFKRAMFSIPSLSSAFVAYAPHPPVRAILQVSALGLLLSCNFACFLFGVRAVDAVTLAGMICTTVPLTFVFGYLLGLESASVEKIVATVLVVAGNLIMAKIWLLFYSSSSAAASGSVLPISGGASNAVLPQHQQIVNHHQQQQQFGGGGGVQTLSEHDHHQNNQNNNSQYFLGVLVLFIAFSIWAIYLLAQRKLVEKMHIVDFLFFLYFSALSGLLVLCVVLPKEFGGQNVFHQAFDGELDGFVWIAISYAVFHSIGTYALIGYGSALAGSSLLPAIFAALQPIFVALEAVVFLGESISNETIIGGSLVVCGVAASLAAIAKQQNEQELRERTRTV